MSVTHTEPPPAPAGQKPPPDGFWMTILGSIVAFFAPMAGLLIGSATGGSAAANSTRLVFVLVIGLVVGGLGVLSAFIGGVRWWNAAHT